MIKLGSLKGCYDSVLGNIEDNYYKIRELDSKDIADIIAEENKNNDFLDNEVLSDIKSKLSVDKNNFRPPTKEYNGYLIKYKRKEDSLGKVLFSNKGKDEIYLMLEISENKNDFIELIDFDEIYSSGECVIGEYRYIDNEFIYTVDQENNEIYKLVIYKDNKIEVIEDSVDGYFIINKNNIVYIKKIGYTGKHVYAYNLISREKSLLYTLRDDEKTLALEEYMGSDIFNIFEDGHSSRIDNLYKIISNNSLELIYSVLSDDKNINYITSRENKFYLSNQRGEECSIYNLTFFENTLILDSTPLLSVNEEVIDYLVSNKYYILNLRSGSSTKIVIYNRDNELLYELNKKGYNYNIISFSDEFARLEYESEGWLDSRKRLYLSLLNYEVRIGYKYQNNDLYSPGDYHSLEVSVRDGSKVEVTYLKSRNSTKRAVIYFYGAYGESITPEYSMKVNYLLNNGIDYIILHVRGGGENGKSWHNAGRLDKKKNTFYDAVDCIRYLKNEGIVNKIVLEGDSAGAASVATVLNLDPKISSGALLAVPFLDVFATMNDPELPLTIGEYSEWGDPNNREAAEYIKSWSPIDNIIETTYPPLFITVGINDPRVGFWEGIKYGYKIREKAKSMVNIHIIPDGGHNGSSINDLDLFHKAVELLWVTKKLES